VTWGLHGLKVVAPNTQRYDVLRLLWLKSVDEHIHVLAVAVHQSHEHGDRAEDVNLSRQALPAAALASAAVAGLTKFKSFADQPVSS
jgi:hypothetical protein